MTVFKNPENWVEFLNDLKLPESGLDSIKLQGRLQHPTSKSNISYIYTDFDGEIIAMNTRRIRSNHPSLRGVSVACFFHYTDTLPPFAQPEQLEFDIRGFPSTVQKFWNELGARSRSEGYKPLDMYLRLDPEFGTSHVLFDTERNKTEVKDHPWLNKRIKDLVRKYSK